MSRNRTPKKPSAIESGGPFDFNATNAEPEIAKSDTSEVPEALRASPASEEKPATRVVPVSPRAQPAPSSNTQQESKPKKKKEGFYMTPEEMKYADLVYLSTQVQTGIRSKTGFYEEAVRYYVKHLEEAYNKGKPYKNPLAK